METESPTETKNSVTETKKAFNELMNTVSDRKGTMNF